MLDTTDFYGNHQVQKRSLLIKWIESPSETVALRSSQFMQQEELPTTLATEETTAIKAIKENLYMDDYLDSAKTEKEVIERAK